MAKVPIKIDFQTRMLLGKFQQVFKVVDTLGASFVDTAKDGEAFAKRGREIETRMEGLFQSAMKVAAGMEDPAKAVKIFHAVLKKHAVEISKVRRLTAAQEAENRKLAASQTPVNQELNKYEGTLKKVNSTAQRRAVLGKTEASLLLVKRNRLAKYMATTKMSAAENKRAEAVLKQLNQAYRQEINLLHKRNSVTTRGSKTAGGYTKSIGRTNAAISNASFAVQDFVTVMQGGGGFERAVLSTTNNLGMMATMLLGPVAGAVAGVAAALASAAVPWIMKWLKSIDKTAEALREWEKTTSAAIKTIREEAAEALVMPEVVSGQKKLQKGLETAHEQRMKFQKIESAALAKAVTLRKALETVSQQSGAAKAAAIVEDRLRHQEDIAKKAGEAVRQSMKASYESQRAIAIGTFDEIEKRHAELFKTEKQLEDEKVRNAFNAGVTLLNTQIENELTLLRAMEENKGKIVALDEETNKKLAAAFAQLNAIKKKGFEDNAAAELAANDTKNTKLYNQDMDAFAKRMKIYAGEVQDRKKEQDTRIKNAKNVRDEISDILDSESQREIRSLQDQRKTLADKAREANVGGARLVAALKTIDDQIAALRKKEEADSRPAGQPDSFDERLNKINAQRAASGQAPIHAGSRQGRAIQRQVNQEHKQFGAQQREGAKGQGGRMKKWQRFFEAQGGFGTPQGFGGIAGGIDVGQARFDAIRSQMGGMAPAAQARGMTAMGGGAARAGASPEMMKLMGMNQQTNQMNNAMMQTIIKELDRYKQNAIRDKNNQKNNGRRLKSVLRAGKR